jgi:hypothetical protein
MDAIVNIDVIDAMERGSFASPKAIVPPLPGGRIAGSGR